MGVKTVENENHVLFECDLYANLRSKLITRLNKAPKITDIETNLPTNLIINKTKLQENFMNMLSPFSVSEIKDVPIDEYNLHHKLLVNHSKKKMSPEVESKLFRRSYIINCLCTFICQAFEKHRKYVRFIQDNHQTNNTIVLNFIPINENKLP